MVMTSSTPARPERRLTRHERASRTEQLAWSAHRAADPTARRDAQTAIIELNLRVARAVANRYRGRGVAVDDLEQAAAEGLLKAVRRFDPTRHHDLLSYAVPTMRGEVLRHFRDISWMVRPPRRVQELQPRIGAAATALALDLGRDPTPAEICSALDVERGDYDEAMGASGCFQPSSLDQRIDPSRGALTIGDRVVDEGDPLAEVEARVILVPLLRRLSRRDRLILQLRFVEDRTQREIGDELGVAQMQVSRWLTRIVADLRSHLDEGSSLASA